MCSLFHFDRSTLREIERMVGRLDAELHFGDIHPTDGTLILTGAGQSLGACNMRWGFSGYDTAKNKKQLLINARAETALTRKSFSESVMRRRCIIPASHFYEWDADKNRATFTLEQQPVLYMAGFYNLVDNEDRFVILTTAANASMEKIHDRMPLILPENQIEDWIFDENRTSEFLEQGSPMLHCQQEYEQMTLW